MLTSSDANSKGFAFTIEASADSPVYNLSLVIHNWNAASVSLFINTKALKEGDGFTVGYVPGLEENYILVFINHKSKLPFSVDIRGR